jgi:lipoprotein-anchoring transpeptidase ErfK/SrfK
VTLTSWSQLLRDKSKPILNRGTEEFLKDYLSIKYPSKKFTDFIYVGVKRQELYLFRGGKLLKVYSVSTSKHGAGSVEGSEMTPVGLHKVHGKYGENVPENGILRHKKFTGEIATIEPRPIPIDQDIITTRIITIEGLERGVNKGGKLDSYDRRIYIHGTAEEGLIGEPASHGCVRLKNKDVMDLFDLLSEEMFVVILNN